MLWKGLVTLNRGRYRLIRHSKTPTSMGDFLEVDRMGFDSLKGSVSSKWVTKGKRDITVRGTS